MRGCCCAMSMIVVVLLFSLSAGAVNIKDVTYTTKQAGKVTFSHTTHIGVKGVDHNCKACHDAIFAMKGNPRYTMADMEQGKSCGACHNGAKAFPLKECARCHQVKEISYTVKSTGATNFSHKSHLAAFPDCGSCHPKLFNAGKNKPVTMAQMEKGKSCGACHNGTKAFGLEKCTACHPTRDKDYVIKGAGNVHFRHDQHLGKYKCNTCHTALYTLNGRNPKVTMKAMEIGRSCGACHNGKKAFTVKANCAMCHKAK